ncbi:MAG TPA: tRNA (guanosine(37)-N1)-methyltransferase TrmD [Terriglobales bacterium]|nr:tRNA (guanosine(37)-N1)-methyltransferase TrmD [Terriglobales bacterium]
MKFEILTIFPDFFRGPFEHGIVRRAREASLIDIQVRDLRAFTRDKHRTVDDRPFGGGEGMVLKPEPIFECAESLGIASRADRKAGTVNESVVLLSPQGELFTQKVAEEFAGLERLAIICGRYEGVDERVAEHLADREISLGDFVLSGGELGAALIVDAVSRLVPGALGNEASSKQESFSSRRAAKTAGEPDATCASGGLLDYPHYTRPAEFRGLPVPEVLVQGDHEAIRKWRRRRALEKTLRNRPDLLTGVALSKEDEDLLADLRAAGRKAAL